MKANQFPLINPQTPIKNHLLATDHWIPRTAMLDATDHHPHIQKNAGKHPIIQRPLKIDHWIPRDTKKSTDYLALLYPVLNN